MSESQLSVVVIGAGQVGRALAGRFAAAGVPVRVAVRARDGRTDGAALGGFEIVALDALPEAAVTVVAVPGSAVPDLLEAHRDRLDGRLLVDATNRLDTPSLHQLPLYARVLPRARVYRAFTTVGWENFTDRVAGERPDMLYVGPEGDDRTTVEGVIAVTGMRPVWLGTSQAADALDGLTRLWFTLTREYGRRLAFRVLTENGT